MSDKEQSNITKEEVEAVQAISSAAEALSRTLGRIAGQREALDRDERGAYRTFEAALGHNGCRAEPSDCRFKSLHWSEPVDASGSDRYYHCHLCRREW